MTRAALTLLLLAAPALFSCGAGEPCTVPGVATLCSCGAGSTGARSCMPNREWSACDCSGRIPLPNAVSPSAPTSGGTGGSGAAPSPGMGGRGGSGTGGSAPPASGDSGMPPVSGDPDASSLDSGMPPVTPDAGPDGGPIDPPAMPPYRACMTDADCDPSAICIQTPGVPVPSTVCAPTCVNDSDCPVPEGSYEAVLGCVIGYCQLDCTPVLFAPLLTCPTGMTCIVAALGNAFCHDDGM